MRFTIRTLGIAAGFAVFSALGASSATAQAAATMCKDGTTSATSGRGACSGHGGVDAAKTAAAKSAAAKSAAKASAKAAKAEAKADAKAGARASAKAEAKADAKADARADARADTKADAKAAAGASVMCADGSSSRGGRGACSGHGGVKIAAAMAAPSAKREMTKPKSTAPEAGAAARASGVAEDNNPAGAIARCKDGLYSHATHRQGACSRHGGVGTWTN
ncbi:MAG: DUF3761 domain-containing protein [Gemmatimonadota bacterium]|nr:DUF3761 domain-containing protein [Gemmatimonadota bacterium]